MSRTTESDSGGSEDEEDYYSKFSSHGGVKSMLLFQFEPQFTIVIVASICLSYITVLVDTAFALGTKVENIPKEYSSAIIRILYAFDIIYFIDLISMTIFRRVNWLDVKYRHQPRNGFILFMEYLTVIPIDGIYFTSSNRSIQVVYLLRLRYTLRILRLLTYYKRGRTYIGASSYIFQLMFVLSVILFIVITMSSFAYILECRSRKNFCEFGDLTLLNTIIYTCFTKLTIMGGTDSFKEKLSFPGSWCLMYMAYLCNIFLISNFTCDIIQLMSKKFAIVHNYERIEQALFVWLEKHTKHKNFFKRYKAVIQEIYTLFWSRKSGIHSVHMRSYMPEVMIKEITFDLSWTPLKHTHIFRNEDIHYLRFISFFMVHTFFAPGEIIYKKNQYKSRMVYIISGVVDILSEEDNETPIISFSDGTCLGESTLIIDYRSTVTVICKRFCEVAILEKKNFITASKLYPSKMSNARTIITNRYVRAKQLTVLSAYQIQNTNMNIDEITMRWLKYILRKLLHFTYKMEQKYSKRMFRSLMFYSNYLDLLAIAEDLALVTDSIFLQKNFPFIFQPTSIFITVWNRLIFIVFTIFSIAYLLNISVVDKISTGYVIFHIIVSILWVIDIYISVSTAVRTSSFYYTTLTDIAVYRIMTPSFVLDLLAALSPATFIILMGANTSPRFLIITECNKLFKFYKTKDILDSAQSKSTSMLVLNKYITFLYYLFLITLYMAGLIHMSVCYDTHCKKEYKEYMIRNSATKLWAIIYLEIYSVCKFLCNFERMSYMYGESYYVLFVVQIVLYIYNLYFISCVSAAETLKILDRHNLNEYVFSLDIGMKSSDLSVEMQAYIWRHVRTMYHYRGFNFLFGSVIYENLPRYLVSISNHIKYGDYVKQIPIFQQTDDAIVKFAAGLVEERIIPKYGLIISEKEICKEMYIIIAGYCKISSNGQTKIIGPGESFNVLEMCLQVTSINTVQSETCCLIMLLNYENYTKLSIRYSMFHREITDALDIIKEDAQEACKQENVGYYTKQTKQYRYIYFGKRKINNRSVEYNSAFSKINMPLKYLLMPITFSPDNPYILGWELLRCISAMAYWFILPINILNPCTSCSLTFIITILDVVGIVDIYIRHHIWYYSDDGVEIAHPLYTARHYWKSGLLMDVLQTFPFNALGMSQKTNKFFLILRMNRLLQIRRVFDLIGYICKYRIQITLWEYLKHLPHVVWILNALTTMQFNAYCHYIDSMTIQCFNDESVTKNMTVTAYTNVKLYISNLFVMTSYFTNTYFSDNTNLLFLSKIVMTTSAFFGYVFWARVTAKMVAIRMSKNDDLFYYHDSLRELLKYMNYRRIDRRLKREVINHFNNMWRKKKGKNITDLVQYFSQGTRRNILFQTFGIKMCGSMVFSVAETGALKSLLLFASHEIILNHGIIYRVNDVLGKIFYLYKGQVEVLGPDLKHLDFLYGGSLFGNLDNCPLSRQTVTVVACGHVELLSFPSVEFHKVLSYYPDVMNYFRRLTCINVDYVEDKLSKLLKTELKSSKKAKNEGGTFKYNNTMKAWRALITILSYAGFILEMYHIITLEHTTPMIVTLYAIDVAYVVKIFLALHTAYEDEYGVIILDKQKIASKYHREILGFYFDVCSVIPIEIACVFFARSNKLTSLVWTYMRFNRLIRIAFVLKNTSHISQKINVVVYIFRTIHIFLWLSVVHYLLACTLFFIDSFSVDIYKMSARQKFISFEKDFNLVINMMMKITITYDKKLLTPVEVFIILSAILSRFLSMHLLAELVTTLQIANTSKYNLQRFALQLNTYMTNENISYPLQKKLYRYIASLWLFNNGMQVPRLLDKAPYYLREALLNSLFGIHLRKHPMFSKCHVDLIRQIAAKMTTRYFFPGNIIAYIGDIDHCMYFIQEGEVKALSEDSMYSEVVDEVLHSGDTFGFDQCIRLRCGHEYTYKVATNTVVLVLQRKEWIYLLDFFPASKVSIYGFDKIEK